MNPDNDEPQETSTLPEKKNYLDHMLNLGAYLQKHEYKYLVFYLSNIMKPTICSLTYYVPILHFR